MLKQAADSGLREVSAIGGASPRQVGPGSDQITFFLPLWSQAQAFLGVLFTKEPYLDEQRAVKYLWLAANSGVWVSSTQACWGISLRKGGSSSELVPASVLGRWQVGALGWHDPWAAQFLSWLAPAPESCWQLKVSYCGSICITGIAKCCKAGFFSPESQLLTIYWQTIGPVTSCFPHL